MKDYLMNDVAVGDYVFHQQLYKVIRITQKSLVLERAMFKRKTKPIYLKSEECVKIDADLAEKAIFLKTLSG